jgi:hypothetical protein
VDVDVGTTLSAMYCGVNDLRTVTPTLTGLEVTMKYNTFTANELTQEPGIVDGEVRVDVSVDTHTVSKTSELVTHASDMEIQSASLAKDDLGLTIGDLTELYGLSHQRNPIQVTAKQKILELQTYLTDATNIKERMRELTMSISNSTTISSTELLVELSALSDKYLSLVNDLKKCHETINVDMQNIYIDFDQSKDVLASLYATVGYIDEYFGKTVKTACSEEGTAAYVVKENVKNYLKDPDSIQNRYMSLTAVDINSMQTVDKDNSGVAALCNKLQTDCMKTARTNMTALKSIKFLD